MRICLFLGVQMQTHIIQHTDGCDPDDAVQGHIDIDVQVVQTHSLHGGEQNFLMQMKHLQV